MDVPRHALLVGIQVHLSLAMLAALAIDTFGLLQAGGSPGVSSGARPGAVARDG